MMALVSGSVVRRAPATRCRAYRRYSYAPIGPPHHRVPPEDITVGYRCSVKKSPSPEGKQKRKCAQCVESYVAHAHHQIGDGGPPSLCFGGELLVLGC